MVFDAGAEAELGRADNENFLAERMLVGVGKPGGLLLPDGDLMNLFLVHSRRCDAHPLGRLRGQD